MSWWMHALGFLIEGAKKRFDSQPSSDPPDFTYMIGPVHPDHLAAFKENHPDAMTALEMLRQVEAAGNRPDTAQYLRETIPVLQRRHPGQVIVCHTFRTI